MKHTVSIKENRLFQRIYNKGKSAAAPSLVVYFRHNGQKGGRLGITVSTKVGKAVVRNRVRRRLREIYRLHEEELIGGADVILVARVRTPRVPFRQLEADYLRLCGRLGLLRKRV